MQRFELIEWLGQDHGLTNDQIDELLDQAADIHDAYPDPDDKSERDAALTVAYRIISGEEEVVEDLARELSAARDAVNRALAGLKRAAVIQIGADTETEAGFARRANIDRMTVRGWLGKRSTRTRTAQQ